MIHSVSELQECFEKALQEYIQALPSDSLHQPMKYFLNLGGKRIRPILVMLSGEAFGASMHSTISSALAVELFHNFSLVHDDIMDEAPLRRGSVTVHEKWNSNAAILSGDAMLIEAYKQLACADPKHLAELLALFNSTSLEVCRGQQLDMDFEKTRHVSADQYVEMIGLKTAVLVGCSLKMGAIIANASARDVEGIYAFGRLAGLGFQIQDDLLDAFGDPEHFGKQVGGDILSNKKTYLIIKALERASASTKQELEEIYFGNKISVPGEKIKRVLEIFTELGIDIETRNEARKYFMAASDKLTSLSLPVEGKKGLEDFLENLQKRAF